MSSVSPSSIVDYLTQTLIQRPIRFLSKLRNPNAHMKSRFSNLFLRSSYFFRDMCQFVILRIMINSCIRVPDLKVPKLSHPLTALGYAFEIPQEV